MSLGVRDDDLLDDEVLAWRMDPVPPRPPGPDRATLWVPSEETLLNAGEHFPGPLPPRIDSGITGRTARHTHLHTMGAENGTEDPVRTVVREGKPVQKESVTYVGKSAEEIALEKKIDSMKGDEIIRGVTDGLTLGVAEIGWLVEDANDGEGSRNDHEFELSRMREERLRQSERRDAIGTVFHEPHDAWSGYSMLTRGGAVHESRFNHLLASGEGDVRAAGKRSVSIGSPGDVIIAVHQGINVEEFLRNTANQESSNEPGPGKLHRETAFIINAVTANLFAAISTGYQIANLANGWNKAPFEGKAGWDAPSPAEYTVTELMNGSLTALGPVFVGVGPLMDQPGGRLDLFSTSTASVIGMSTAKLYGLWFTSIGALGVVSINAGGALAMSSNAQASLGAPKVGINSIFTMAIECQLGKLTQRSRKTMELSSQDKMLIASDKHMQITSVQGQATLFGKDGFFLAAGGGDRSTPNSRFRDLEFAEQDGYGVHGTKDELFVGRIKKANTGFEGPGKERKNAIRVTLQVIDITNDKTKLEAKPDAFALTSETIKVTAKRDLKVTANGRVLIGD